MAGASGNGAARGWRAVFVVALVVFVAAVAALAWFGWSYWADDNAYRQISDGAIKPAAADGADGAAGPGGASGAYASGELPAQDAGFTVDWDYLRGLNPDVVAWVYAPDTRINYPVAQGADNEEYLWTSFSQEGGFAGRSGCIFLDWQNSPLFTDRNSVIYGHHMNDGSMFATLSLDFADPAFFDAHRTVYVLTPERTLRCTAFALVRTDGWDEIVETNFLSSEAKAAYVQDKIDRSVVTPAGGFPDAADVNQMVSLSTCDYHETNGRVVLFCQVEEDGQAVDAADADAVAAAVEHGVGS